MRRPQRGHGRVFVNWAFVDDADWQIWVQADATPVPRRFAITYVNNPEKPEFLAALDRWSTNRVVDDDQFKASLPDGIQQIKFEKQKPSE